MKSNYWYIMTECYFELTYIGELHTRYVKIDRFIKIVLAIMTSASIATWAIWQKHVALWGIIVAVSQVIYIINEFLPYNKRIIVYTEFIVKFSDLQNDLEYEWYYVLNNLSDDEINKLCRNFNERLITIRNFTFFNDAVPEIEKIVKIANDKKKKYFLNKFKEEMLINE